ncbi:protein STU1 [Scheffersomyces coipomensis]|uniref:protein STU1 n=1 Tax=Scheffersomyces coipomensis TaxID=1788519 RepID=UPI00315DD6A4
MSSLSPTFADEFFQSMASKESDASTKLNLVNQLKTHIKKDCVDLNQVPKYIEALSIAVDIPDLGISASGFSALSHLIKRVSMQDKSGNVLRSQSFLVLPIIINRLGDSKSSTVSSARKALEAYWFSAPNEVDDSIIDVAFKHRNTRIIIESINWLNHIIMNINQHFKLNRFITHIAKILASSSNSQDLIDSIQLLLTNYYNLKQNRLYKFDLARELEIQNVSQYLKDSIMNGITGIDNNSQAFVSSGTTKVVINADNESNRPPTIVHETDPVNSHPKVRIQEKHRVPTIQTRVRSSSPIINHLPQLSTSTGVRSRTNSPALGSQDEVPQQQFEVFSPDSDQEFIEVLKKVNYQIDSSIPAINLENPDFIYGIINEMTPIFNGKETEQNWGDREKIIIKFRSIIRGNSSIDFKQDLITCLKECAEGICKAISSLRTTLSAHGCQLIKESVIVLKSSFDPLIDSYLPTFIRLSSSTKNIASTNANMAICAIFANASYNSRLLQRIQSSSIDKSIHPRAYSCIWLQLMILRFHDNQSFINNALEVCNRMLLKIMADPNPNVRSASKDLFWCYWGKFPDQAENLLAKSEPNIVKAIERSKPKANIKTPTSLAVKKARPSLKETIIERNKELKIKQRENSRPSSRANSNNSINNVEFHRKPDIPHFSKPTSSFISSSIAASSAVKALSSPIISIPVPQSRPISKEVEVAEVRPTHERAEVSIFDKQSDPILKFLSSNQLDLISEGINLLKYAIMGEEDLSNEVSHLLQKISLRQPKLLEPLILSNDDLFKKTFQFFNCDDFIRICGILINPMDERIINLILSIIDIDPIFESIIKLLSYTINTSNILGDDELMMQIIQCKHTLTHSLLGFLFTGLDKIPISDSYYSKLTSTLLELLVILKSTDSYPLFSELLSKVHSINPVLFNSELDLIDVDIKEEVEYIVGIDNLKPFSREIPNSVFELTEVPHKNGNLDGFSPVKMTTDFTMLWPIKKENDEYTYVVKKEPEEEALIEKEEDIDLNTEPEYKNVTDNEDMEHEQEQEDEDKALKEDELMEGNTRMEVTLIDPENVFIESPKGGGSDQLANDLAQVKLEAKDSIQNFIDKVDPLRSFSNKNKPISIYEDFKGSPQKVRNYDYSEVNWFNLQLSRYEIDVEPRSNVLENFEIICENIKSRRISKQDITDSLEYFQVEDPKFSRYYNETGKNLIIESILVYFNEVDILSGSDIFKGLVLLQQLIINRTKIELPKLWDLLLRLATVDDTTETLGEIFDEMLTGIYSSNEIIVTILNSLKLSISDIELTFALESLSKVLASDSLAVSFNEELVSNIDELLRSLINSRVVDVRRYVILCYGRLLKASKNSGLSNINITESTDNKNPMDTILSGLTVTQKKLVEYYSEA